jgi:hypothetical protein
MVRLLGGWWGVSLRFSKDVALFYRCQEDTGEMEKLGPWTGHNDAEPEGPTCLAGGAGRFMDQDLATAGTDTLAGRAVHGTLATRLLLLAQRSAGVHVGRRAAMRRDREIERRRL